MVSGIIIKIVDNFIDVLFSGVAKPELYTRLTVSNTDIILEVLYHLEGDIVRTISLSPSIGLQYGLEAVVDNLISIPNATIGRISDPIGRPLDERGPMQNVLLQLLNKNPPYDELSTSNTLLETGIKVIDLFTPIIKGKPVFIIGGAGVGKTVNCMELINNIGNSIYTQIGNNRNMNDFYHELEESGIKSTVSLITSSLGDPLGLRLNTYLSGVALAEAYEREGKDALLFMDGLDKETDEFYELSKELSFNDNIINRCVATKTGSITPLILVSNSNHNFFTIDKYCTINLSRKIANLGIYPAIDPLTSQSHFLNPDIVGTEHYDTALKALNLLQRYNSFNDINNIKGIDKLTENDRIEISRARKLQRFLSQPFHVAEVFTGVPGKFVTIDDTIDGVNKILNGDLDDLPEQAFYMVGNIKEVIEKAKQI